MGPDFAIIAEKDGTIKGKQIRTATYLIACSVREWLSIPKQTMGPDFAIIAEKDGTIK